MLVNTSALTSASLWRIVVSFLVQVMVARGLALEALGQYTVAMAFLNISQVLCEMGMPLWLTRELAQAPQMRRVYFKRATIIQGAAALLLWAILALLVRVLPYPPVTRAAIFWVGASLPLFAVTSAAATIFQAAERMKLVFIIEASTNLLILLLSGWMIWQQRTVEDLLRVVVVAQGVGMLLALALLLTRRLLAAPQRSSSLSWGQMLAGTMPFFGLSLTDVLLQRLDILLLSLFANPLLLGTYSAAYNLVRVGIKLIQSLWRAVYPTLARLYPTTPARARQVANMLLFLGIILCILVTLIATVSTTPILRLVYGLTVEANGQVEQESFALLSGVLSWLVWQVPLFFVELYATTWLLVVGREHAAFVTTLIHVILLALLLPIGAAFYGAMGAAWGTVAAQALGTVVAFWFMYRQRPNVRKA